MPPITDLLESILGPQALAAAQPHARPAEYEPTDLALKRIRIRLRQGRFDDLLRIEQKWVRERYQPSIACYGCYPPPSFTTRSTPA